MTEFHADDYGLFPTQSGRILRCRREGALNGTSIMPNSPWLEQCLDMLPEEGIALSVHLNLMEGRCLAPKEELPLLTDAEGVFRVSFLRLLLCPLTGRRGEYRAQIKKELRAQIRALQPAFARFGQPLRLDGHAHWHMLPVVFDALMELIAEEELPVAYIRIPREPFALFWRHLSEILPVSPINIVKTLLLHMLAGRNLRRHRERLSRMEKKLFIGVLFSGRFDYKRMRSLLPDAERLAEACGWGLELLAHPGAVYEEEDIRQLTNRDDHRFLTSPDRETEAECFCRIGEREASHAGR